MKNFVMMAAALVLGFTLQINDAEAKRIGGGGSTGMQRQSVAPSNTQQAAPRQATQPAAAGQAFSGLAVELFRPRLAALRAGD